MKTKNIILTITLFLTLNFILPMSSALGASCEKVSSVHKSTRLDCRVPTENGEKTFHVLKLKGKFSTISYDHAYLMAREAHDGLLKEISARFDKGLSQGSFLERRLKREILGCFQRRMERSVSKEFLNGVDAFYHGLERGAARQGFEQTLSYDEIYRAPFGIDLSNLTDGLEQRISENGMSTYLDLLTSCGIDKTIYSFSSFLNLFTLGFGTGYKFGCLGMVAPDSATSTDGLVHARNLDADLVASWNKAPTLFLVEENGYYKYVAAASAGNMYPGGISGFNEKGISVSLHQMSTTKYSTRHSSRRGVIAPFLQQRILREAASIDEAIKIIKSARHFAAWTILIGDSNTNEVASVEYSGRRVQVARRTQGNVMAQSNHFLGSKMQNDFFYYSFNKKMETASRMKWATAELRKDSGDIDVQWMIEHLAGHTDAYEGFRSFGRTATKIYTVMSTIAVPLQNEFWITLGDRRPASHSQFLGFKIDFENMNVDLIDSKRTQAYEDIPNWEDSLAQFSSARLSYEKHNLFLSEKQVRRAIQMAKVDGIDELPYYYIHGRLLLEMERFGEALKVFDFLYQRRMQLHPYHRGLIAMYSVMAMDELRGMSDMKRNQRLLFAQVIFNKLYNEHEHFDLEDKQVMVEMLQDGDAVEAPHIHFVTIE